ncbi:MAG: hypothetical protein KDH09_18100 [Chrysiogenetes bacterium]|nr:hypothetical protein [Chrysiogenetes bacterium]
MAKAAQGRADVLLTEYSMAHLAAAAALTKAGRRVVVLSGESVSEAPDGVLPPLGLLPPGGPGTLLERLLDAGEIAPRVRTAFRTPPILFQVIWPGFRVDVCSNPQDYRRALNREFGPEQAERITRFEQALEADALSLRRAVLGWNPFPPAGFFARFRRKSGPPHLSGSAKRNLHKGLGEALGAAGLGEDAQRFIKFYLSAMGVFGNESAPFAPASLWLADSEREHALLPPEDVADVRELIQRALHKRGAQLLNTSLQEVSKGPEGLWRVRTADGREVLARYVIEGERALQQNLARQGGVLLRTRTLRAVIEPTAIPPGMCPRGVIVSDPAGSLTGENLIAYLIERPGEDEKQAKLYATVFSPEDGSDNGPSREAVMGRLETVLPYVQDFCARSAWLPAQAEARFPAGPRGLRNLGLVGAPHGLKGKRHLALGRSNAPLLGVWGELKSAFSLADRILEKLTD